MIVPNTLLSGKAGVESGEVLSDEERTPSKMNELIDLMKAENKEKDNKLYRMEKKILNMQAENRNLKKLVNTIRIPHDLAIVMRRRVEKEDEILMLQENHRRADEAIMKVQKEKKEISEALDRAKGESWAIRKQERALLKKYFS